MTPKQKAPATKTVMRFEKPVLSQSFVSAGMMLKSTRRVTRASTALGGPKAATRSVDEEMKVLTVATRPNLSEYIEPYSIAESHNGDESIDKRNFLKKGEKSRKYDPKQAIIKHH